MSSDVQIIYEQIVLFQQLQGDIASLIDDELFKDYNGVFQDYQVSFITLSAGLTKPFTSDSYRK